MGFHWSWVKWIHITFNNRNLTNGFSQLGGWTVWKPHLHYTHGALNYIFLSPLIPYKLIFLFLIHTEVSSIHSPPSLTVTILQTLPLSSWLSHPIHPPADPLLLCKMNRAIALEKYSICSTSYLSICHQQHGNFKILSHLIFFHQRYTWT